MTDIVSEKLREIYYNLATGLNNAKQLYVNVNKDQKIATMKQVKEWLQKQEVNQVFTKKKKIFNAIIGDIDDYQIDNMFFNEFKKQNSGYIGLFNAINITSRKAYCYSIKNKTEIEIKKVFESFFKDVDGKIKNITSDNEATFNKIIKGYSSITHWKVDPDDKTKVGMIERFNRTIRSKIRTYMKLHKTKTWYKILPDLVTNYNNSVHFSIN
jgi:hypothetical protein